MFCVFEKRGFHLGKLIAVLAFSCALIAFPEARGQMVPSPPDLSADGRVLDETESPRPEEARLEPQLGERVPAGLEFVDESGERVRLGDFLGQGRPVVVNLGYYSCPQMCGLITQQLARSLGEVERTHGWVPGEAYDVLTISWEASEGPSAARQARSNVASTFGGLPSEGVGWHFLTVADESPARELAARMGYYYHWSDEHNDYIHPSAVVLLTPEGRVARYLEGTGLGAGTLRMSLVEASEGEVGSFLDQAFLFCYSFDAERGEYTWAAMRLMQAAGALTVLGLGGAIGFMALRGARRQRSMLSPGGDEPLKADGER